MKDSFEFYLTLKDGYEMEILKSKYGDTVSIGACEENDRIMTRARLNKAEVQRLIEILQECLKGCRG